MQEVRLRGWDCLDVILISGDAYVDHPSFGTAVIGRLLESEGLRVAILPQPNWQDDLRDFKKLGSPNLFFGVTSGCMDSMVNHYTAAKRRRSNDAYTPGGKKNFRPDYATTVYARIIKKAFPDVPVVLGGIEASLRRVTHYDYWSDSLKRNILSESGADLLIYGMGEQPLREMVRLLKKGVPFASLKTINQTAFLQNADSILPRNKHWQTADLNSHELCLKDKKCFAANFKTIERESNKVYANRIIQRVDDMMLIINPPYAPMSESEIDGSFDLPFTRLPHPKYAKRGDTPAYEMIKHSINLHRGCFGGCSFCTISAHQGKFIASRSKKSIMREVDALTRLENFQGTITDMGGPSANMYKMKGINQEMCDRCAAPSCVFPRVCKNLNTDHYPLIDIYKSIADHPEVKHAFVGSGIRYDLFLPFQRRDGSIGNQHKSHDIYLDQLTAKHVSGRLKVAPEHSSPAVLKLMRKPAIELFHLFKKKFIRSNEKHKLNQQLIPYFISSHPGSEVVDMAGLAVETRVQGFRLEQIQDFTPTPMTVATVIYYSGYHPITLKKVYTARSREQKEEQRQFFFWYRPEYRRKIQSTLRRLGLESYIRSLFGGIKKDDV